MEMILLIIIIAALFLSGLMIIEIVKYNNKIKKINKSIEEWSQRLELQTKESEEINSMLTKIFKID